MKFYRSLACLLLFCPLLADPCIHGKPSHISIGTRQGKGMGYEHGYTTASLFLTPNWQREFQPIFDGRVHFLNNATWASNLGGALRFGLPSNFALGGNFFYDFRSAKHIRSHQLGAGLELLHPIFDVNINGYAPIGRTKTAGPLKSDGVSGYHFYLKQRVAFALPHIEAMTGFWLPKSWPLDIYWAAGPYYLFGRHARIKSCGSTWGAKTFLEATITDGIVLGGQWTYDQEYHGRIQGYVSFSYPLGPNNIRRGGERWSNWYKGSCDQKAVKQRLLTGPIRRDEIIPVCDKVDRPLPLSVLPGFPDPPPPCYFVNNSLATNGDGTFENPFNNLASAEAASAEGDCIYVYYGTGATTPGYDTGFFLKNNQVFYSSSYDFVMGGITVLPAQTPGQNPTISGAPGYAVTLANGNLVNGFTIDTVRGITGTNVAGGTVSNNIFNNPLFPAYSINISSTTGDFYITNNLFNEVNQAINISDTSAGTLIFSNNTVISSISTGDDLNIFVSEFGTVVIENNYFDMNAASDLFQIFLSSNIPNTYGNIIIRNNTIIQSGLFNIGSVMFLDNSGSWDGVNLVVDNNNITSTTRRIFTLINTASSLISAQFTNNTITQTASPANFSIFLGGLGDNCGYINGNTIVGAEIRLSQSAPGFFEASPGSAAAMSAANNGVTVNTLGTVNFNATLPQPQCTP